MNVIENIIWLVLVAVIWGVTNPLMKKGSVGIEEIQCRNSVFQFLAELKFLALNWKYMFPFAVNLGGSVIYYLTLGSAELSIAVPITNSLTFIFTTIAGKFFGEETSNKSTYIGMILVVMGTTLCVLDKIWNSQNTKT